MIGYYVHHHGRGHVTRALAISMHVDEDIVFMSSLPRPAGIRPRDRWVRLPMDGPAAEDDASDPDARGHLHWAPLRVDGLIRRSAELLSTLTQARVRRLVVDVSVEIAVLARTAGVPVTIMAMPGNRADAPHQLAYGLADQIIAPWSDEVYQPRWLADHAERTHFVGAISRFDGQAPGRRNTDGADAVLLIGAGGADVPADAVEQLQVALPRYRWVGLGGRAWIDDPWAILRSAAVIVTHAGQNALADAAMSGAATMVLPQHRPFGEQHASASALARAGVVVSVDHWPVPHAWPGLLDVTLDLDPDSWHKVRVVGAAARAARVLAA
ncbi:hypothetical protein BVC93_06750 [Mycobacterium sp. MS1601]|uniref:hypothetical protein n=1 Tax=Mycobacterium sp. MS1601 TaxID=1936029 RepID=UPI00097943CB|nr:hypothetical protein [Mycobacterium sp. MS1601]AQA02177.1 hypothetical protein BVC93_06750 [Mycobacterium sp. MS1601]